MVGDLGSRGSGFEARVLAGLAKGAIKLDASVNVSREQLTWLGEILETPPEFVHVPAAGVRIVGLSAPDERIVWSSVTFGFPIEFVNLKASKVELVAADLFSMRLTKCRIGEVDFSGAHFRHDLRLSDCALRKVKGSSASLDGDLEITDTQFQSLTERLVVELDYATIGKNLRISPSSPFELKMLHGRVEADTLIGQSPEDPVECQRSAGLVLQMSASSLGFVRIYGVKTAYAVKGPTVSFVGTEFRHKLEIGGDSRFRCGIDLSGASVGRFGLQISNCEIVAPPEDEIALRLDQIRVEGALTIGGADYDGGCRIRGRVVMDSAEVAGAIDLSFISISEGAPIGGEFDPVETSQTQSLRISSSKFGGLLLKSVETVRAVHVVQSECEEIVIRDSSIGSDETNWCSAPRTADAHLSRLANHALSLSNLVVSGSIALFGVRIEGDLGVSRSVIGGTVRIGNGFMTRDFGEDALREVAEDGSETAITRNSWPPRNPIDALILSWGVTMVDGAITIAGCRVSGYLSIWATAETPNRVRPFRRGPRREWPEPLRSPIAKSKSIEWLEPPPKLKLGRWKRPVSGLAPFTRVVDCHVGEGLYVDSNHLGDGSGLLCLVGTRYSSLSLFEESPRLGDCESPIASAGAPERDTAQINREISTPLELTLIRDYSSDHYSPDTYQALAASLKKSGRSREAKRVLIQMHEDARHFGDLRAPSALWNRVSGFSMRYGYEISRVAFALVAFVVLMFIAVWILRDLDLYMPTQWNSTSGPLPVSSSCPQGYPCMNPLPYTLEMLVPIANFHQLDYWQPVGWLIGFFGAVSTVLAWAMFTLLVTALSNAARRDHESAE